MSFWEREVRFGRRPDQPEPGPPKEEPLDLRPLLERGEDGVTELLERLQSSDFRERIAAAEALSDSDDSRAPPELIAAFQNTFPGRSSRRFLLTGWAFLIGSMVLNLAAYGRFGWIPEWLRGIALCALCIVLILRRPGRRSAASEFRAALADALIHVAERRPTREMRAVADDLRLVTKEFHTLTPAQRRHAGAARTRLMELTGDVRSLPLAADAVEQDDAATLPRTSGISEAATASLPVAVQKVGRTGEP